MDIRGVVFDLDNTLLQSNKGAIAGIRVAAAEISQELRKNGLLFSELQILRRLNRIREGRAPSSGLVSRSLYDRDNWWKLLLKDIHAAQIGGPWIHKTTLRYWDMYQQSSPPFPDAEATVKALKQTGYRLAIVSDSDGTRGMKKKRVDAIPFRSSFEFLVVAGEDTANVKPSKAPFRLVTRRLKLPPEKCAYVGDNPQTDISGAKAIGMTTILIKRKPYWVPVEGEDSRRKSPRPAFEINALKEIPTLLSG